VINLWHHERMEVDRSVLSRLLGQPLGEAAYRLVETLEDAGHETWWVGGSARDLLLGNLPVEIDLATAATPREVKKLFPKSDDRDERLGAVRVSLGGAVFEVTTFRAESTAVAGREPEQVTFSDRETDAQRRDFTVNALYYHPIREEMWDPYRGAEDLHERLVRFIGDPPERIRHDPLRLLRAVRLRAALGGQYHPDTYRALQSQAAEVKRLSGGRCLEELQKMLLGPAPATALEDLWETETLLHLLPELHRCKGIPQPADYHREGDVWDHTLACVRAAAADHGIDVRLAALFHDCGKAETFSLQQRIRFDEHASVSRDLGVAALGRLQCPTKRREKIGWLVAHHMMLGEFAHMTPERKAHWYYHPWFTELLQLFWLDIQGTEPAVTDMYDQAVADYNRFLDSHPRPPKPLLSGEEIMDILGIAPGERVGEVLQALEEKQIHQQITTKKEALAFVAALAQ
jgi:poly(A) polymerase